MRKMLAFPYYGGKYSCLKDLLPIINAAPHTTFVESYGGSGAIILNKTPSDVEVYNDLNSDVVNFFRVLREEGDELIRLLHLTPYSREEFTNCCDIPEGTNLHKAWTFFVRARQVSRGLVTSASPGRWAYTVKDSRREMSLVISRWLSSIEGLENINNRLRTIQIENLDGKDVIQRYDRESTLHYVDPPYPMEVRTGGKAYKHEYKEQDHAQLLDCLKQVKGKVILSSYANKLYDETLNGWVRKEFKVKQSANANFYSKDKLCQEVIWSNF